MKRYLWQALVAHWKGSRTLLLLTIVGVALGVASVLSIQILNRASLSAFAGGIQAISGDADFSLVGTLPTFDESLFPIVLADRDIDSAWPLFRVDVALADEPEFFLEVWGTDLFAPSGLPVETDDSSSDGMSGSALQIAEALTIPGWIAITPKLANERGWRVGDTLVVTSGSRLATLTIGALVDFHVFVPLAPSKLAIMDLSQVQSLFGEPGQIGQIDVRLIPDADRDAAMRRIEAACGPGAEALTLGEREDRAAGLMEAFRLNLSALSLISVFVGVFLVYAAIGASLVRRRTEFGLLRSLGSTRGQVLGLVLAEVSLLGILGVLIGIPLGYWAALQNIDVVSATLTNVYLLAEIEQLELPPSLIALAFFVGVGGALLGALPPALDMTRRDTRSLLVAFTLHEQAERFAPRLAAAAAVLLTAGGLWYLGPGRHLQISGFVLGSVLLIALPATAPWVVQQACRRFPVSGLGLGLSLRSLGTRLQTTGVAVAALGIAVSMLIGITLLIGSFRETLDHWIDDSLRADIYITTESWARAGGVATMDDETLRLLETHPGVRAAETLRQFDVRTGDRKIRLGGVAMAFADSIYRIPLLDGEIADVLGKMREQGHIVISEPLARKERLQVGDSLRILTPRGEVGIPIAGISYDYSTEGGSALLDLDTMNEIFGEAAINNVALYLEPGVDVERAVDELKRRLAPRPLVLRSNRTLREEVFLIFDQTFAITRILQGMASLIAAIGIALTLLVLAQERLSELALLSSLGASRGQVFRLYLGEGLSLAVLGLALGLVGGLALAAILIFVINRAYFGWTIQASWPIGAMAVQILGILATAVVASLYPAFRASRVSARELSREDV